MKQILPEPSKPGEGTGGIGRAPEAPGPLLPQSFASEWPRVSPGLWVSRRPMGPLALSPLLPSED